MTRTPDPILAAIAKHRRLWGEFCAATCEFEKLERLESQTPFFKRQMAALTAERDRLGKAEGRAPFGTQ
jgi:hypothetical protein